MTTRGFVVWFTGLPCAGKSTLASALAEHVAARGRACEVLDGDEIRRHLSHGLGFSREDRDTNVRRIGYVAGLLARHGVAVIVAAVSPYRATRDELRRALGCFVEVYVACPLEHCERRDVKGLYAEARAGRRVGFTGIDDPYEPPVAPELTVRTDREDVATSTARICARLHELGYVVPAP